MLLLFLGAGLVLAQPCAGGSGDFEPTGSLATARGGHTATLLPDGTVLVVGGRGTGEIGEDIYHASAELYDPASATWSATGGLTIGRSGHTATLLPNGKVLAAGGYNGGVYLAGVELYDPASGTWTATASLPIRSDGHTATLLPSGKVLVAGGTQAPFGAGVSAGAALYDPASGTWTSTGSLATARFGHTATLLPNGEVLVAGGLGRGWYLADAELYDPASETWTATGSMGVTRGGAKATLLPDGKVLVAGGSDSDAFAIAELYDPASGTWTSTGSLATARFGHTATLLPNGEVLVAGGRNGNSVLASAELSDPAGGSWTPASNLNTARCAYTATLLPNGRVLVAGGLNNGELALVPLASAELYVGPPTPPTFLNISTRLRVLTGDNVLIGGFIITGTELKRVLIRGIGPSLNGVGATLSDPTLELHRDSTTIATNDNWKLRPDGTSQQGDIEATTIPPTNDLESAILVTVSPGTYTAILAGTNGGTGVGLVEVYDLGQGANSQLANISTRGFVDTGDNVMIGGLIVGGGSGTARALVRALGPSVPVAGALGNPTLELHDGDGGLIASNDDWRTDQETEIIATTIPPPHNVESAIVRDFAPGIYTAIVRGANNTTGVALVEAYRLGATPTPTPSPTPAAKFVNLTTRNRVGTGEAVTVNAFIITGPEPKPVIVRGLGPTLTPTPSSLQDPILELRNSSGGLIFSNDNWRSDQEAEIIATGLTPTNDFESAIVATLPAHGSAYTATLRGVDGGTGYGSNDLYDLEANGSSRLTAVGTRGEVSAGNVLSSTLIVHQGGAVLVRLLGPTLPLVAALPDPTLQLRNGNGEVIAANDNWRDDPVQEAEIIATGIPPSNDLESAIVRNLPAGVYAAMASGVNNTTGIAYVQFYGLPHSGPVLNLTP